MNKVKIAFCLRDMQIGGVETIFISLLEHLYQYKNIELVFISYVDITEPIYSNWFKQHPKIQMYSLYPSKYFGTKLSNNFFIKLFQHIVRICYRNIKRIIFDYNKFKDIDVFVDYYDFDFYKEFQKLKNKKKIAWLHSSINKFIDKNYITKVNEYNKLVVLTDECKKLLHAQYKNKIKTKIIRIYNPVNIQNIISKSKKIIHGLPKNYFCSVMRLSEDKDIKTLLDGFNDFWICNNKPNVKLLIVGSGHLESYWKQYANNLQTRNNIVFVGSTDNPYVYMKHSLGNILSSPSEGLPTVILESIVLNTLNIASACKCGPKEILLNGKSGLLFEPGNIKQLSERLSDVWNKNIDIAQIRQNAKRSLERFNVKNIITDIIDLFS